MLDFSLAPIFLLASDQERSNSATLLPRFSLALVGFLDVQSFQMSTQERCFASIVRLKFQIAWYISDDGLVQLGLMWRRVELGFGIGSDRHINP